VRDHIADTIDRSQLFFGCFGKLVDRAKMIGDIARGLFAHVLDGESGQYAMQRHIMRGFADRVDGILGGKLSKARQRQEIPFL
jgi:hypothetical protein